MRVFIKAFLHEIGHGDFEVIDFTSMTDTCDDIDIREFFDVNNDLKPFVDDLEDGEFCEVFLEIHLNADYDYFLGGLESFNCAKFTKRISDIDEAHSRYSRLELDLV